jgi:hypothetical protein
MSVLTQHAVTTSRGNLSRILIGCAIMFTILQIGVTWLAGLLDQTWAALIVTVTMVVIAIVLERLFFKHDPARAVSALGFGRPNPRAILVASIIAVIMLAFFPFFRSVQVLKLV